MQIRPMYYKSWQGENCETQSRVALLSFPMNIEMDPNKTLQDMMSLKGKEASIATQREIFKA